MIPSRSMPQFIQALAVCALFAFSTISVSALDFRKDVRPILSKKCFRCHSGPKAKGKLRYDDLKKLATRIGTHEDAVFVPGNPQKSLAIIKAGLPRSDGDAMPPPPSGKPPLTAKELALLKQWVSEGAKLESSAEGDDTTPKPTANISKILPWTNVDGNKLEAAFVSSDGTHVTLKKADGSEFEYPLAKLSAESQKQAKELAAKN